MLIVAIIDLPDTPDGTGGDGPQTVADGVLARLADEAGYADDGGPYGPASVVVHALTTPPTKVWHGALTHVAAATASTP